MQLKYLALASLLSLASADEAQFRSDLQSYFQSVNQDPSIRSMWAGLATLSPSQVSQLRAAESAAATDALATDYWATPPAEYSAFPSPFNSYYLSAWSVEKSLAIKDGVLTAGPGGAAASTPAMASGGASPTAAASSMASASAASSGASSAGAAGATGTSSAGAAGATGVMAMGAVAGIIGAAAALL